MQRTDHEQKDSPTAKGIKVLRFILVALHQTQLAFGVLVVGLISTGFVWYSTTQAVEREAQIKFDRQVDVVKTLLRGVIKSGILGQAAV